MLMASLPFQPDPFAQTRTPISRATLERRLGLLEPEDAALLREVEALVQWEAIEDDAGDDRMLERLRETVEDLRRAGLRDLAGAVEARLELRSVVAALRHRHLGRPPPAPAEAPWRASRDATRIAAHWEAPDLGLSLRHSWVGEAQARLADDDPLGLEKLLLGAAWRDLAVRAERHRFDFTAVVLYVLRWDIFHRWTRQNGREAAERFEKLLAAALRPHAATFAEAGIHV